MGDKLKAYVDNLRKMGVPEDMIKKKIEDSRKGKNHLCNFKILRHKFIKKTLLIILIFVLCIGALTIYSIFQTEHKDQYEFEYGSSFTKITGINNPWDENPELKERFNSYWESCNIDPSDSLVNAVHINKDSFDCFFGKYHNITLNSLDTPYPRTYHRGIITECSDENMRHIKSGIWDYEKRIPGFESDVPVTDEFYFFLLACRAKPFEGEIKMWLLPFVYDPNSGILYP